MKTHQTLKAEVADEIAPFAPVLVQQGATLFFALSTWRVMIIALFLATADFRAHAAYPGLQGQIPAAEYAALVDLYNTAGGSSWGNNQGWNDPDATEWYGVGVFGVEYDFLTDTVLKRGNVTNLSLIYLSGSLPNSLGSLSHLNTLILSGESLSGGMPVSIGDLVDLTNLVLVSTHLTGPIPDSFGNLHNLRSLRLSSNYQLSGPIPDSFGNLRNLVSLQMGNNTLLTGGIPQSFGNLTNLQDCDLTRNQLTGLIPESIGNLKQLKSLYLGQNQLSGTLPVSLGNLTNLEVLDLNYNNLTGSIPSSITNLHFLKRLVLEINHFSGRIPAFLGYLTQLEFLDLFDNEFTEDIPDSLGSLSKLQYLVLNKNQVTGRIPDSLGNLSQLRSLNLEHNQLSGSIPSSLGNLTNLTGLNFINNQLSGSIPASLVSSPRLNSVYIYNNCLVVVGCLLCVSDLGTPNRAVIDQMIAAGKHVFFQPQNQCVCLALSNDKVPEKWGPGWFANVIAVQCSDGPTNTIVDLDAPVVVQTGFEAFGIFFLNSLTNRFQFDSQTQSVYSITVSTPAFNGITASFSIHVTTNKPAGAPPLLNPVGTPGAPGTSGTFSFNLADMPGQTYLIQTTTNLLDWDSVRLITLPATGRSNVSDTLTQGEPQKFYRALLQ